jgi:3' terminal RNA ribose 2'-O-methyltransferase Hen1
MLLTITTTAKPATDLGYLLHKNPARVHAIELAHGTAHVFYPEATEERCTAALLLELDPVGLVRGKAGGDGGPLAQYVNDRPYVASSFMSVAIGQAFGTALSGRSKERPELVKARIPLEATLASVPSRGGEPLLRRLFEPLGYTLTVQGYPLDADAVHLGPSSYYTLTLRAERPLVELLQHLYALIPVLDAEKHYWVGDAEVEKLLRHGEQWLASHPDRELIARRYLKYQPSLARQALARLTSEEAADPEAVAREHADEEHAVEEPIRLNERRMGGVLSVLTAEGVRSVVDLGCGEGRLLQTLLRDAIFERLVGVDVSVQALERAGERLHLERLPAPKRARITLLQGSVLYRDKRLAGYDAVVATELVEHLDPPRLAAFERTVFEFARPRLVVVTTPNVEYNVHFANLPAGRLRHRDHRFEWTRDEFRSWAGAVGRRFGYEPRFVPVGPEDAATGAPTQMGIFARV